MMVSIWNMHMSDVNILILCIIDFAYAIDMNQPKPESAIVEVFIEKPAAEPAPEQKPAEKVLM